MSVGMSTVLMANRFASYSEASDVYYSQVVPTYGATRKNHGFGKWLYLPSELADAPILEYWGAMEDIGILTEAGQMRLHNAMIKARHEAGAQWIYE